MASWGASGGCPVEPKDGGGHRQDMGHTSAQARLRYVIGRRSITSPPPFEDWVHVTGTSFLRPRIQTIASMWCNVVHT